jgi:hypothetical protein
MYILAKLATPRQQASYQGTVENGLFIKDPDV